ncbi:hypothetical protein [Streptomyces sp. NPDC005017]|uniref:hypothetical protein n=1 Tax=Streptomyces sp. NPDC005017 TaxID=3364706 RepID=UPI0036931F21
MDPDTAAAPDPERHTLEALGLSGVPHDDPLSYPGVWPRRSGLLDDGHLWPLTRLVHPDRTPVLAVGSNASPGQLGRKMARAGLSAPVPMVKVRVTGLAVGVSAHVSRMGYVSASPLRAPGAVRKLFVAWLDGEQLAVVDASEGVPLPAGNFRRAWLPAAEVPVKLEDGRTLPGVYAYVNRRGVLHDGGGTPRPHPGQRELLTGLLAGLPRLRELFGTTPEEFVARARADAALCEHGTRLFAEEGLVTRSGLEAYVPAGRGTDAPEGH